MCSLIVQLYEPRHIDAILTKNQSDSHTYKQIGSNWSLFYLTVYIMRVQTSGTADVRKTLIFNTLFLDLPLSKWASSNGEHEKHYYYILLEIISSSNWPFMLSLHGRAPSTLHHSFFFLFLFLTHVVVFHNSKQTWYSRFCLKRNKVEHFICFCSKMYSNWYLRMWKQ